MVTLVPALLAFLIGAPKTGSKGLPYNSALLFTGKAAIPLAPQHDPHSRRLEIRYGIESNRFMVFRSLSTKRTPTSSRRSSPKEHHVSSLPPSSFLYSLSLSTIDHRIDPLPESSNNSMALQFSLQNMLDLIKYVVTIIFNKPSQFKCVPSPSPPPLCRTLTYR